MASFDIDLNDGASGPAKSIVDSMGKLASSFMGAGESSSGLTSSIGEMSAALGPIPIIIEACVTALLAFGAAAAYAMSAAIEATQAKDALRTTFDALGKGAGAGQKTLDMLEEMSKTLPYTTDQLAEWAKGLMAAGIQGKALETSIKAIAAAQAIMGTSGAAAAEKLIKKLAEAAAIGAKVKIDKGMLKQMAAAGVSADALASALGVPVEKLATMSISADKLGAAMQKALISKGKGALEAVGLTWDTIKQKLAEGFGDAFEDLGELVKPFMQEVQSLFGEFYKGTPIMKGFAATVKGALTVLFAVGTKVVNGIHLGLLKMYIAWLRVKIAIAPVTAAIAKLIPSGAAITVLTYIVKGLAVVFGILAVAIFIASLPLLILIAAVVAVGAVLYAIGAAIVWLVGKLIDFGSAAIDAGRNFITGLVSSISSGASSVVAAVLGLAGKAVGALKSALGIKSPSKVAIGVGANVTGSLADAIDDGSGDVHAAAKGAGGAVARGLTAGADGADGAAGGNGGGGKGGVTVNVEKGAIVINGAAGDAASMSEEAVASLFQRLARQEGLVPS